MSCGNNTTEPVNLEPFRIYFTPDSINLAEDEQTNVTMAISELAESIFGLCLQMTYDSTVVKFSDTLDVEIGDFFGPNAIAFIHSSNSTLHLSITKIQGQEAVSGSGDICVFPITGKAVGDCRIQIVTDEARFYSSSGDEIEMSYSEPVPLFVSIR
ncbi:MAG: hypothetical protein P9M15_08370 [Candidatus Electryoneaceae bacterium]|nr:hypothetical protein [Candidatus Electryoneaceae bacterium]